MYLDRQALANSVEPDQMPQNVASDQGLHCLMLFWYYFRHIIDSKMNLSTLGEVW